MDSGFQVLDSSLFGTWILNSLVGFRIPDSLIWAICSSLLSRENIDHKASREGYGYWGVEIREKRLESFQEWAGELAIYRACCFRDLLKSLPANLTARLNCLSRAGELSSRRIFNENRAH